MPDGSVIGTTFRGGRDGLGVVYPIGSDRTTLPVPHDFASNIGYRPGGLVLASDGMLYGLLVPDPECGGGTFRMATDGSRYEQLHKFKCVEGRPTIEAVPIEGPDGAIYATPIDRPMAVARSTGTPRRTERFERVCRDPCRRLGGPSSLATHQPLGWPGGFPAILGPVALTDFRTSCLARGTADA